MSKNLFADNFNGPFVAVEEWLPLKATNDNAPLGIDMPSFAERRGVQCAVQMFEFTRSTDRSDAAA